MTASKIAIVKLSLVLCLQLLGSRLLAVEHNFDPQVFLKTYCHECHGQETQKGDHRFDTLPSDRIEAGNVRTWQNILDVLHLGQMPPRKDGITQPTPDEVRDIVGHLEKELAAVYAAANSTGGETVYRRLNRFEYRNTIRDLLGIRTAYIDPTESFLPDEEEDGLDNIGSTLVTSDYFLQQAMLAAEKMIKRATHFEERPRNVLRSIEAPIMHRRGGSLSQASRAINPFDELFGQSGRNAQAGYIAIGELPDGVKVSGRYRVRVTASSNNQRHPWGDIIKNRSGSTSAAGCRHLRRRKRRRTSISFQRAEPHGIRDARVRRKTNRGTRDVASAGVGTPVYLGQRAFPSVSQRGTAAAAILSETLPAAPRSKRGVTGKD